MINLGLNRKITKVISENLNDTNSEIYKEISNINSEYDIDSNIEYVLKKIETGEDNRELITILKSESITKINEDAFKNCINLTEIDLPNCTTVKSGAFINCTNLKTVKLPSLYTNLFSYSMGNYGGSWGYRFDENGELDDIFLNSPIRSLTLGINHSGYGGGYCTLPNLVTLCLPNVEIVDITIWYYLNINEFIFIDTFENLIFPSNTMVNYGYSGSSSIGEPNMNCNIYVPDDLVETYRNNTNWSIHASQIKPLSELPDDVRKEITL